MTTVIYLITLGVMAGTPLAIFGMKYWAAAKAANVQSAALSAIQSELAELKTRMASVEKILKEVE